MQIIKDEVKTLDDFNKVKIGEALDLVFDIFFVKKDNEDEDFDDDVFECDNTGEDLREDSGDKFYPKKEYVQVSYKDYLTPSIEIQYLEESELWIKIIDENYDKKIKAAGEEALEKIKSNKLAKKWFDESESVFIRIMPSFQSDRGFDFNEEIVLKAK